MTQLVVHTGMPLTGVERIRAQLAASREPLDRAGIAVVRNDEALAWERAVRQVFGGETPQLLRRITRQKLQDEYPTLLLSSSFAAGALASPNNVTALHAFSRDNDVPVEVVLVVREQLDLLNASYCRSVLAMETSVGFERFVADAVDDASLDLGHRYAAVLDDPTIDVTAVPYSGLDADRPAAAILAAAGLPVEEELAGLRSDPAGGPAVGEPWLPGPILLTATRLLHKRLTRRGVMRKKPTAELVASAAAMRERATEAGWDDEPFWGWSPEHADSTARHFAAGNAAFAARMWDGPWTDAPASRPQTRQDLAAARPAVVSDVMTMIHRVVDDLVTPAAAASAS